MARTRIVKNTIPQVRQEITIDDQPARNTWCSQVDYQAGVGGVTAKIEFPLLRADQIGDAFHDKKIVINAGPENGSMVCVFVGFLSSKAEDISESADSVTMTAYSAGYYLDKIGVGEEGGYWRYQYPLINEDTGAPTGWTPLRVLTDLFNRLPAERLEHLQLGNTDALGSPYDIPVQGFDFSLTSYKDAIETIVGSMGDVAVREIFHNGICYLDFFRIGDPAAPVSTVVVAEYDDPTPTDANVGAINPNVDSDDAITRVITFGRDKEFMITCRSYLATGGAAQFSEPNPDDLVRPLTALEPDWDSDFEAMVTLDPKMANSIDGRTTRTAVMKPQEWANGTTNGQDGGPAAPPFPGTAILGPGYTDATFWIDTGIHLVPEKTILVHQASGERMLVTAYTPWQDAEAADPDNDPPIPAYAKRYAQVTVERLYQPAEGQTAGNLMWGESLIIEVPGIEHVFRRYKLPEALVKLSPKIEIQSDLPLLDPATNERRPIQPFMYVTRLAPNSLDVNKKVGNWQVKPQVLDGCSVDKEKLTITLSRPAVQPISEEKKTVGGKTTKETKYEPTVVGITFSYIDPHYTFGWDTGVYSGQVGLPWASQCEREQYDEMVFQKSTNTGYPVTYYDPVAQTETELTFNSLWVNPDTNAIVTGDYLIRNDIAYLQTLAYKRLAERFRRRVSYDITIKWLDLGYALGNRLEIQGLENQPEEMLTITGVTFDMPQDQDSQTTMTVDNRRPPARRRWRAKMKEAV